MNLVNLINEKKAEAEAKTGTGTTPVEAATGAYEGVPTENVIIKCGRDEAIESQDSQESRPEEDTPSPYRNVGWKTIELAFADIKDIDFPDYHLQTQADRPIVGHTDQGYFIIDGKDMVMEAVAAGKKTVQVDICEIGDHSETELWILKAASRTRTRGGNATYIELCRNTRTLFNRLCASDENLKVYQHGGSRNDDRLIGDRKEDVMSVLSMRLGKNRGTLNVHLNYARYLSDDAIAYFITAGASKDFFSKVQSEKKSKIQGLEDDGVDQREITEQISQWIIVEFAKENVAPEGDDAGGVATVRSATRRAYKTLELREGEVERNMEVIRLDGSPDIDTLKGTALQISTLLEKKLQTASSLDELEDKINHEVQRLNMIIAAIQHQRVTQAETAAS